MTPSTRTDTVAQRRQTRSSRLAAPGRPSMSQIARMPEPVRGGPTPVCPSMSQIARLPDPERSSRRDASQIITLDYFRQGGALEDYARFSRNGLWVRRSQPLENGVRVVVHLVLPELLAPIALQGTVVGSRFPEPDGSPWVLVWFDDDRGEDYLLLQRVVDQLPH